jgi:hypothetical protein
LESIEALYRAYKEQAIANISTERSFIAIVQYFKKNFKIFCESANIRLDQMIIIYIIPDHFAMQMEIIDVLLKPLFVEVGVISSGDQSDRITFSTYLESAFASDQQMDYMNKDWNKRPYMRRENQCLVYRIHLDDELTTWEKSHIQLKEDITASFLDLPYFRPKFISVKHTPNLINLDFIDIKQRLINFIVTETLKLDLGINDLCSKNQVSRYYETISDGIVHCALANVCVSILQYKSIHAQIALTFFCSTTESN